jgi:hypothetical protein
VLRERTSRKKPMENHAQERRLPSEIQDKESSEDVRNIISNARDEKTE